MSGFSVLDWIVIGVFLTLMILLGFLISRRNKSETDYVLGGRNMNPSMVGLSLFATTMSTLSYLAFPGEMIRYGYVFFFGCLSYPLAYFIVKRFLIPRFMELNVKSAYEILEIKLGKGSRLLATLFFLLLRFLWMSTVMYATVSTALVPIFGIDPSYTLLITVILILITLVYTTFGGMRAVVLTDTVQTGIMFFGAILVIVLIAFKLGDAHRIFNPDMVRHWDPVHFGFDATKRMTICNILLMRFSWQVCTAGSDQMAIQRYMATKDVKSASHSYKVSLYANAGIEIVLGLAGFLVLAFFFYHPDMMAPGTDLCSQADTLFPRFIRVGLPTGLTGLIAAAIMAAAMSSLSSGLNSSATVILEDLVKPYAKRRVSDEKRDLKAVKLISALLGVVVTFSALSVALVPGNLLDLMMKVVNLVVAPLFVLFFLALFVKGATDRGTILAGLFSFGVAIAIAFFEIFGIKGLWIMPISFIAGALGGVFFSFIDRRIKKF